MADHASRSLPLAHPVFDTAHRHIETGRCSLQAAEKRGTVQVVGRRDIATRPSAGGLHEQRRGTDMQVADFPTEVPTPDPLLRTTSACRTITAIGDAGRRGGVETLVMDGRRAFGARLCDDATSWRGAASRFRPCHAPVSLGVRAVAVTDDDPPAGGGDDGLDDTYRTLSPWLNRKLRSRLGVSRSDIDDLVQESFIRLRRYSRDDRQRHPRALLLRIAGNLARDAFRREAARGGGRSVAFDPRDRALRLSAPADQHARAALKQAILDLPDHLRDVFVLSRFTPMTNDGIARHLGISIKTVEWRLAKATALCVERLSD